MIKYGCVNKSNGGYTVRPFDHNHPIDREEEYSALMMSRLDIDVQFVDLPHVQSHVIYELLKYRLRSIYPGTPEKTIFDYIVFGKKNRKYAALFITQKHIVEAYKEFAGGMPLFLPLSLVHHIAEKYSAKRCVFVFIHSEWIEVLVYREGVFRSSCVMRREDSIHDDLAKLPSIFPEPLEDSVIVFLCAEYARGELQQSLLSWEFIEKIDCDIVSSDILNRIILKKSDFLFADKKEKSLFIQRVLLPLLAVVTLLMAGAVLDKHVRYKKAHHQELIKQVKLLEAKNAELDRIQTEIETIEDELLAARERTPNNVYHMLSELSVILGKQTKISHFLLEKNRFQVEGFGPNPLLLMERFTENDHFKDVKLSQIIPLPAGNDKRFKVSGFVDTQ